MLKRGVDLALVQQFANVQLRLVRVGRRRYGRRGARTQSHLKTFSQRRLLTVQRRGHLAMNYLPQLVHQRVLTPAKNSNAHLNYGPT